MTYKQLRSNIWVNTECCIGPLQVVGIVNSLSKGKNQSFDKIRRALADVCSAVQADMVAVEEQAAEVEQQLHSSQVSFSVKLVSA